MIESDCAQSDSGDDQKTLRLDWKESIQYGDGPHRDDDVNETHSEYHISGHLNAQNGEVIDFLVERSYYRSPKEFQKLHCRLNSSSS